MYYQLACLVTLCPEDYNWSKDKVKLQLMATDVGTWETTYNDQEESEPQLIKETV